MGKKLGLSDFIDRATKVHNCKYTYENSKYSIASAKLDITCPIHGSFLQRAADHMRGDGCPRCKFDKLASSKRSSSIEFIEKAMAIHGSRFNYYNVAYKNAITKVEIECTTHGSFMQTPDKHLGGGGCPQCSYHLSRGEFAIVSILDRHNIRYVREKRFPDLVGSTSNSRLRYDFWLPDYNCLIEYDGEQHFEPINIKGRLSSDQIVPKFQAIRRNDAMKNQYARDHGIELIRIPYNNSISDRNALIESHLSHILDRHRLNNTDDEGHNISCSG